MNPVIPVARHPDSLPAGEAVSLRPGARVKFAVVRGCDIRRSVRTLVQAPLVPLAIPPVEDVGRNGATAGVTEEDVELCEGPRIN